MPGNSKGIVNVEHLEGNGGTASEFYHLADQLGLKHMVVRVVMLFTEKNETGVGQTANESLVIHKACGGNIPYPAGQGMVDP